MITLTLAKVIDQVGFCIGADLQVKTQHDCSLNLNTMVPEGTEVVIDSEPVIKYMIKAKEGQTLAVVSAVYLPWPEPNMAMVSGAPYDVINQLRQVMGMPEILSKLDVGRVESVNFSGPNCRYVKFLLKSPDMIVIPKPLSDIAGLSPFLVPSDQRDEMDVWLALQILTMVRARGKTNQISASLQLLDQLMVDRVPPRPAAAQAQPAT